MNEMGTEYDGRYDGSFYEDMYNNIWEKGYAAGMWDIQNANPYKHAHWKQVFDIGYGCAVADRRNAVLEKPHHSELT